jgi:hypothetical protein
MAENRNENEKSYDHARQITENALDAYVGGDEKGGSELINEAKAVNEAAVKDVRDELQDDAGSEHDVKKLNDQMAKKQPG